MELNFSHYEQRLHGHGRARLHQRELASILNFFYRPIIIGAAAVVVGLIAGYFVATRTSEKTAPDRSFSVSVKY